MNLILAVGDWFAQNWMLLLLIAVLAFFVVSTFLKQKKELNARNELANSIKKGTKIVTTAGVYGVVESVEETTDGKVVTIKTGNSKNPSTMVIHINAIMGIDNKTSIKSESKKEIAHEEVEEDTDVIEEMEELEEIEEETEKSTKKKSSK